MFIRMIATALVFSAVSCLPAVAAGNKPYLIGYDETKSLLSNKSMMTYDRGHGTQVEFIGKNGKTYLFYPGNTGIVHGAWKLTKTGKAHVYDMCFKYPSQSYNPSFRVSVSRQTLVTQALTAATAGGFNWSMQHTNHC